MPQFWTPSPHPEPWSAREIGRIEGCTNPESCELAPDGETLIFGNCTMTTGHPGCTGGPGIVYLQGEAFVSRARIASATSVILEERRLANGLTGALAVDFLPAATRLLPKGAALIATGGRPIARADSDVLVEDPTDIRQQLLAFDPQTGQVLGRIPLWSGSAIGDKFNPLDQPNGMAIDSCGNVYAGDIVNGSPDGIPTAPSAVYRIPVAALDDLIEERPGAAEGVERLVIPGAVNGVAVAPDDTVRVVSCSPEDPICGGIYRLEARDFSTGRVPAPLVSGLGILDGVAVTRRGTELCSNPLTGQIHAFLPDGSHRVVTLADTTNPVAMPADINVCYPRALHGEPALLAPNIAVGSAPGSSEVVVLDISGL